ncbi:hypothetical protein ACHAWF_013927 [Thalassiosira exigua]
MRLLNSLPAYLSANVTLIVWGIIFSVESSISTAPTGAFNYAARSHRKPILGNTRQLTNWETNNAKCRSATSLPSISDSNFIEKIAQSLGIKSGQSFSEKNPTSTQLESADSEKGQGQVIRTAARPHQSSGGSVPSSREYTTRKTSLPMIDISYQGVTGDYNHYRTVALKSTSNRAISILTSDVSSYIKELDQGHFAKLEGGYKDGDLGENILVKGINFSFFQIGQRYQFTSQNTDGNECMEDVIIEITEPMEPCANLCKLPYINAPSSSPKERIARCQYFIEALGQKQGLRGWYAKVIQGGFVRVGDLLSVHAAVA